jgi:hypothetical protein
MRRRTVVAAAALIAAFALAGLPVPAGSRTTSATRALDLAAFTTVPIPANAAAVDAPGVSDAGARSTSYVGADASFLEPGTAPDGPTSRPQVSQPVVAGGSNWKPPKSKVAGYATFYDNGTTAMRIPAGTLVRICGPGGCILRTVNDYGPQKPSRVVDMYRPDFFRICGCPSWSGTVWVTVSIY